MHKASWLNHKRNVAMRFMNKLTKAYRWRSLVLAYNEVQFTRPFFKPILIYTFQQFVVWAKAISSKKQKQNWFALSSWIRRLQKQTFWPEGEGDSHKEKLRMLFVSLESLRNINQGFWSHSGCSLRNAIIFSCQSIFKQKNNSKNALTSVSMLDFCWSLESSLLALPPFLNSDWYWSSLFCLKWYLLGVK